MCDSLVFGVGSERVRKKFAAEGNILTTQKSREIACTEEATLMQLEVMTVHGQFNSLRRQGSDRDEYPTKFQKKTVAKVSSNFLFFFFFPFAFNPLVVVLVPYRSWLVFTILLITVI